MKKKYTWIRQITRVLLTLMLTIAVSVPVMAEPKAIDADTQLSNMYTVTVASGYLALRTEKAYRDANEIGQLYTGLLAVIYDRLRTARHGVEADEVTTVRLRPLTDA